MLVFRLCGPGVLRDKLATIPMPTARAHPGFALENAVIEQQPPKSPPKPVAGAPGAAMRRTADETYGAAFMIVRVQDRTVGLRLDPEHGRPRPTAWFEAGVSRSRSRPPCRYKRREPEWFAQALAHRRKWTGPIRSRCPGSRYCCRSCRRWSNWRSTTVG